MIRKLCVLPSKSLVAKNVFLVSNSALRFASTNQNNKFYRETMEARDLDKDVKVSFGSSSNNVSNATSQDLNPKFHWKNKVDDWSVAIFFAGLAVFYYIYTVMTGRFLRAEAFEEYNYELAAKGQDYVKQGAKDGQRMTNFGFTPKQ